MCKRPLHLKRNSKLDRILLDANAGLALREEVLETFIRVSRDTPGNPSSIHRAGRHAQAVLENAREDVAGLLHCAARDIVFTSGATEANNLAILGLARAMRRIHEAPINLIASRAEHPAALAPLRVLQHEGNPLTLVDLDSNAKASVETMLHEQANAKFSLTVLQWVNNETGVIQPIEALANKSKENHLWHCDAVQGFGKIALDQALWNSTTMALSGHKFGAPKGVGVLRLADQAMLEAIQVGGGQQRSLRSGTESPALAACFAHALSLAIQEQESYAHNAKVCCNLFISELEKSGVSFQNNHSLDCGLPNTLNLSFPELDGRMLIPACDADGLELSAGAACSSGAALPSPVLIAAGRSKLDARASIRISFMPNSSKNEAILAGKRLATLIQRLYKVANR